MKVTVPVNFSKIRRPLRRKPLIIGLVTILTLLLGWTATAQAHSTRSGDYTKVSEGEIVRTSLFVGGRQIDIAGEIEGDLFCAGSSVTITGRVQGDVICAAQSIRISGTVDGDVRLVSQDALISGSVGGSMTVVAQRVELQANGQVERDVSAFASDVFLFGDVGRDVEANARSLTIDGEVGRDVDAHTETLSLNSASSVAGNVTYPAKAELRRDPAAIISGRISRDAAEPAQNRQFSSGFGVVLGVGLFVAMLATTLLLVLLAPKFFEAVSAAGLQSLGKTILVGLAISLAAPVVITALMLSVVGIPLAILLTLVWCIMLFMSGPIAAFMTGRLLLRQRRTTVVKTMLVGSFAVLILYLVPIINVITVILVIWSGVGAAVLLALGQYRSKKQKPQKVQTELKNSSAK